MRKVLKYFVFLLILGVLAAIVWWGQYRFYVLVSTEHMDCMDKRPLEGYTDKLFYFSGDCVKYFINSQSTNNSLTLLHLVDSCRYDTVLVMPFGKYDQTTFAEASQYGCKWTESFQLQLPQSLAEGYYFSAIEDSEGNYTRIPFIVGNKSSKNRIALLAPVTTWVAYNAWGGKSLYDNFIENANNYNVSTQRPMTSFDCKHDIFTEANAFLWLSKNYDVSIYPDYILEQAPELLSDKKVIFMVYHCEYFSADMFDNLNKLVDKGHSFVSMGGNQIYWKIKWHDNFTRIECRKDLTFFDNSFLEFGGQWRHNLRFPERLTGVRYLKPGIRTFAPYKVLLPNHWLYEGLNVSEGMLFGERGYGGPAICGAETDKVSFFTPNSTEIIAHGLNPATVEEEKLYWMPNDPTFNKSVWDASGGGDFVFRQAGNSSAVLSTGSIQSTGGLGYDSVFTGIIRNFLRRYAN